jgi:uncharacterized protein (DUF2384 family)
MKYYSYKHDSNSKYGTLDMMFKCPVDVLDILIGMPGNSEVKEISKSTYYRWKRQDAQAFWNNLEHRLFGQETA